MMNKTGFLLLLLVFCINAESQDGTPAFPTAEGYGKWASGGRGGGVVYVTHLKDNTDKWSAGYKGSLRAALETSGSDPITIVFSCSGIIQLTSELRVSRDNVTIAGQTAPGDGICIKGGTVNLGGSHNLIIRHIRFRTGLRDDTYFIEGACLNIENGGNFIIDHCSFSWSAEENIGFYDDADITVQWCISAEALYNAGHPKGVRSYGAVLGGSTASYHHNLLAHNVSRSPRFGTSDPMDRNVIIDYVNNVNYNWGSAGSCYGGENEMGPNGSVSINMVNNYYKPGPAYPGTSVSYFVKPSYEIGIQDIYFSKWHINGNYMEGAANTGANIDNWSAVGIDEYISQLGSYVTKDSLKTGPIEVLFPVETQGAQEAFNNVLNSAGAFPRDAFDRRIIREVSEGTATSASSFKNFTITGIVDKPSDSGGYPVYNTYNKFTDYDLDGMADSWEIANGLDTTSADDRNLLTPEGYTYLEVYINGMAGEYLAGFDYSGLPASFNNIPLQDKIRIRYNREMTTLFMESEVDVVCLSIFDIQGRLINTKKGGEITSVSLDAIKEGVYILVLELEDRDLYTFKILK